MLQTDRFYIFRKLLEHLIRRKFWRIFEKKKIEFFIAKMDRSWLVQKSKNVENFGNFGHISKNKTRNELLVFFGPVGPQDAMFGKTRFFQPFSSYSKVRGTQK